MQHPDPQLFIRRIFLDRTGDHPTARYRTAPLNPRAIWGMSVPVHKGALIFDKYIAPLSYYEPTLLATEHIPADIHMNNITLDLVDPLIVQDINTLRDQVGAARLGGLGAEHQKALQGWRDSMITKLFNSEVRRLDAMPGDWKTRDKIVKDICTRTCMSLGTISAALWEAGIDMTRTTEVRHEPSRFSVGHPHRKQDEMLQAAIRAFRSAQCTAKAEGSFKINDLLTSDPGGYPLICPVTGLDLDWTFEGSFYSPKVSKRAASEPTSSKNICIVSMLGKRIIMSSGSPQTIGRWFNQVRGIEPYYVPKIMKKIGEWAQKYPDPVIEDMYKELRALGYNADIPSASVTSASNLNNLLNDDWEN